MMKNIADANNEANLLPDISVSFDQELEMMLSEIELGLDQSDDEAGFAIALDPRPLRDGHHVRFSDAEDLLVLA